MIRIKAPAKINLSLAVIGKQTHFHEVEMVMTTIDLSDYVTVSALPTTDGIIIKSECPILPLGKSNLVYQAAEQFMEHFNIKSGVEIEVEKHIPIAGGLAGGSSDAAATFKGLRELFRIDCPDEALCKLGGQLGSDIPFCLIGGTALATGRGEIITPLKSPPKCWVVIINPRFSASTRDIYDKFRIENADKINTRAMLDAIENEDFDEICARLANNLEPITTTIFPAINQIKKELYNNGASGVRMSGSGPTVFALVYTEKKANHLYKQMKKVFASYSVYMARMLG